MTWLSKRAEFARKYRIQGFMDRDPITETPIITIHGERQTGKTEMLIDRLVRHAQDGMRIAYVGRTLKSAVDVQRRMEALDIPGAVFRRGHGCESVRFASGGVIRFLAAGRDSGRGLCIDVLAWDDVGKLIPAEWMRTLAASPGPLAYRVVAI